jgi:hypothetical protein
LRGAEFVQGGAITLDSGVRPTGFAYNPARGLLAWSEGTSSRSLYLASLASAGRRIELRSDVQGLVPVRFSEDGNYLARPGSRTSCAPGMSNPCRPWRLSTRTSLMHALRRRGVCWSWPSTTE